MTRTFALSALALVSIALASPSAPAQNAPAQAVQNTPPPKDAPKPKRDEKSLEYEKFIKDLKRVDSNMPLYQKGKRVYLELPEAKLGKPFLIQAGFSTGLNSALLHAGMPVGFGAVDIFRFDRSEDLVNLVRPNVANRWEADDEFRVGAERSFPEALLSAFPIEQQDPEKKLLLVNITNLFNGDFLRLNEMVQSMLGGPYMPDSSRSGPDKIRGYKDNTIVQMKLHYVSPRGSSGAAGLLGGLLGGGNTLEDDRSASVRVTYNFWWRNSEGYRPRLADPRVGFFTEDFNSISRFAEQDRTTRYINRFRLEKKDPKAAISEPVKPIVWTIDSSIPERWRPAVRDGVLRWNKAFEKIGYKNAIQVQDVPKTDPDYDHADGRYNVIRFLVGTGAPFAAIALARTDPLTGEVLNASVTVDGDIVKDLIQQKQILVPESTALIRERSQKVLLRERNSKLPADRLLWRTEADEQHEQLDAAMKKLGWSNKACTYCAEKAAMSQSALLAIEASGANLSREKYVSMYLADTVSHEVGHTLGLRHNFAGSTFLTTQQLADAKLTREVGLSGSVMDYTPPNAAGILTGKNNLFMETVGPYDIWAMEYGYKAIDAKTPIGEKFALSQIAAKSGLPGLAFMTDEDADGISPNAVRFDLGGDSFAYSLKQLETLRRARLYATKNLPRAGESYSDRTKILLTTITRSFNEGRIIGRYVGGSFQRKNFKGDAGGKPTLEPVSPAVQRLATQSLVRHFFDAKSFELPTEVLSNLPLDEEASDWNAPLRDLIGAQQARILSLIASAATTDRVAENAFKAKKGAYTVSEHYGLWVGAIFAEVGTGTAIYPLRRDLQRTGLTILITQANAPQGAIGEDVRLVTNDALKRLSARLAAALAKPINDDLTRLHLADMHDQIRRFQARQISAAR